MSISKYLQATRFKDGVDAARINANYTKKRLPSFALILFSLLSLMINCANPANDDASGERFTFTVADVGQGLAQFGVVGKRAAVWDVGDQYQMWYNAYRGLGNPRIESIIISHTDFDHYGALQSFGASLDWSGEIVISPYEDTAKLRRTATAWANRVTFKRCARGDTLRPLGSAVDIICLWPPRGLVMDSLGGSEERNRYGLVFSVRHGNARALIASDIDDAAMTEIAAYERYNLRAQILSVPHHGSAGSVSPLFFSYVSPEVAVISCSADNGYGHPSPAMIHELQYHAGKIMYTYIDGTVTFGGNKYYWSY